jgi:RNA recognition motif-containing protein
MSRGNYSQGKRRREAEKARKKKDKALRKSKRERDPNEDDIGSTEEVVGNLLSIEEVMQQLENRSAPRKPTSIPSRLFVGGLSWDTTEAMLQETFVNFGPLIEVVIVKDRDTGDSRGFGFVTMADRKDASRAIKALNNTELDGRRIEVNAATDSRR